MTVPAYRYKAFISYCHRQPDRKWAKWLLHELERFNTPRELVKQGVSAKLGKVFRDDDEISASSDLGQTLESALRASEYLLVVCSSNTPLSHWVRKEIQFFQQLGRADKIICLLVEGEPDTSFPAELSQSKSSPNLKVEPLAADVRARKDESRKTTRSRALIRIASSLLGCGFDDLQQRERQRLRRRKQWQWGAAFISVFVILSAYALLLLQQTRELNLERSIFLAQLARVQSDAVESSMDEDEGQYDRAIRYAMIATIPGLLYPQADQAKTELVRALHGSTDSFQYNQADQAVITALVSPGQSQLLMVDESYGLSIVDLRQHRLTAKFQLSIQAPPYLHSYHPSKNWVALSTADSAVHIVDLSKQKTIYRIPPLGVTVHDAEFSSDGSLLLVHGQDRYNVWDLQSGEKVDGALLGAAFLRLAKWIPWHNELLLLVDPPDGDGQLTRRDPSRQIDLAQLGGGDNAIERAVMNKTGTHLYIYRRVGGRTSKENYIEQLDAGSFEVLRSIPVGSANYSTFLLSEDEKSLILSKFNSVEGDKEIEILRLNNKPYFKRFTSPGSLIVDIKLGAQAQQIITSHTNGNIRFWDIGKNPVVETLKIQSHDGTAVHSFDYLTSSHSLISFGSNGQIIHWALRNPHNRVGQFRFERDTATNMEFNYSGDKLVAYSKKKAVLAKLEFDEMDGVFNSVKTKKIVDIPAAVDANIAKVAWSTDDTKLLFYYSNGYIEVVPDELMINLAETKNIASIHQLGVSPDKQYFGLASQQGIYLGSQSEPANLEKLNIASKNISHLVFDQKNEFLAIATYQGEVNVWSISQNEWIYQYRDAEKREINAITFSEKPGYLAFSMNRGPLVVLRSTDFSQIDTGPVNREFISVKSLHFSDNFNGLYVAGPTRKDSFGHTFAEYNLSDASLDKHFVWVLPIRSIDYAGLSRRLLLESGGDTHLSLLSEQAKTQLATFRNDGVGVNGGYAVHDARNLIATGRWGQVVLWDISIVGEPSIAKIRASVCAGVLSYQSLFITQRDVRIAPILTRHLGKNVCDIGGLFADIEQENIRKIRKTFYKPMHFFEHLQMGLPNYSSRDALAEFLAYFNFDELEGVTGQYADKANLLIAMGYWQGLGVETNVELAKKIYRELAERGNLIGQHNLAALLEEQSGPSPETETLMLNASANGMWLSQRILGIKAQALGEREHAISLFKAAAASGDGFSEFQLGLLAQSDGQEGESSDAACRHFEKAASLNQPAAELAFAECAEMLGIPSTQRQQFRVFHWQRVAHQDADPQARLAAWKKLALDAQADMPR